MSRRVAIGVGAMVTLIAVTVILLASGGPVDDGDPSEPDVAVEQVGDVVVGEGGEPPGETELADIVEADVTRRGARVVFRARMTRNIPQRVKGGGMTWRWDIYDAGVGTWILSANLDIGPVASLTSTQTDYGSSTFDDSLPGEMTIEGDKLTITLTPGKLEDWPEQFEWTLGTMLDGAQGNPRSALATDAAPDEGLGTVEEG